MSADKVLRLFERATELNRSDPLRNGNMLNFPAQGDLLVAGDLHNHTRNFERFKKVADLGRHPDRHVILQEVIHGGPLGPRGEDRSFDMLIQVMEWAKKHPGQVHFLLANHDMAQIQHLAIMKDGYDLTDRFSRYIDQNFGNQNVHINQAFQEFSYTMPLAAITVTGLFFSHSLPSARDMKTFDRTILRRDLMEHDYDRNGPIYQLIWGRNQTQEVLHELSRAWWSEIFICGHQAQDTGYGTIGDRMLIIDSSHNHGVFLRVDLARQYTLQDLINSLTPFAAIG